MADGTIRAKHMKVSFWFSYALILIVALYDPIMVFPTLFFYNSHIEKWCYLIGKINLLIDVQLIA
jgi:hypothetical protein